jgi:hypothetical protein
MAVCLSMRCIKTHVDLTQNRSSYSCSQFETQTCKNASCQQRSRNAECGSNTHIQSQDGIIRGRVETPMRLCCGSTHPRDACRLPTLVDV